MNKAIMWTRFGKFEYFQPHFEIFPSYPHLSLGSCTQQHPVARAPDSVIVTVFDGFPSRLPKASILLTILKLSWSSILPKTTCLPSNQSVFTVVMKNWAPLVFGPELAMDSNPGDPCFTRKFSSLNFLP